MEALLVPLAPDAEITLSHKQIDDYQTCPLKYFNVHVKRIPIRRHHAVAYGAVVHKVVEYYLTRRAVGNYTPLDDLLAIYERAWAGEDILHDRPGVSREPAEGFLTREHEEARKARWQGEVLLELVVDETGKPRDIRVVKSLGLGLDEEAIKAVSSWRFKPGTKDGNTRRWRLRRSRSGHLGCGRVVERLARDFRYSCLHHAPRRADADSRHGADVSAGQPQQAQRRARPAFGRGAGRFEASGRHGRRLRAQPPSRLGRACGSGSPATRST